jgi:hypothetical protein
MASSNPSVDTSTDSPSAHGERSDRVHKLESESQIPKARFA